MENPKKNSAHGTYRTLRECLTDSEYLAAQKRMEEIQKRYLKRRLEDDIEPIDWDEL